MGFTWVLVNKIKCIRKFKICNLLLVKGWEVVPGQNSLEISLTPPTEPRNNRASLLSPTHIWNNPHSPLKVSFHSLIKLHFYYIFCCPWNFLLQEHKRRKAQCDPGLPGPLLVTEKKRKKKKKGWGDRINAQTVFLHLWLIPKTTVQERLKAAQLTTKKSEPRTELPPWRQHSVKRGI